MYLAQKFVSGVNLAIIPNGSEYFSLKITQFWQILVLTGSALGIANIFIKPFLKTIALPLRLITFGLFSFIINIAIIWLIDLVFPELEIQGLIPLLWTTAIVLGVNWILIKIINKKDK